MITLNKKEKDLALAGKKIEAIRAIRERTANPDGTVTVGLFDAKVAVEGFIDSRPKDYEKLYTEAAACTQAQARTIHDLQNQLDVRDGALRDAKSDAKYHEGTAIAAGITTAELRAELRAYKAMVQMLVLKTAPTIEEVTF